MNQNAIMQAVNRLQSLTDRLGILGPLLYIGVYVAISLVGFSVAVLSLIAVTIFPPVLAFFVIITAGTLSAYAAFFIARHSNLRLFSSGSSSKSLIKRLAKTVETNAASRGFRAIFLLRLAQLPYIALSYAAGFVPTLSTRAFVLATLFTNMIAAAVYVLVGTAVLRYITVSSIVLLIGLIIYAVVRRLNRKKTSPNQRRNN